LTKIWNVETGLEVVTLKGHKMSVNSVAYSPDGKFIASGSQDKTVKIWSVKTYLLVATLAETKRGHASAVRSVCWSSDGTS
jgi:WD40 repeat protein